MEKPSSLYEHLKAKERAEKNSQDQPQPAVPETRDLTPHAEPLVLPGFERIGEFTWKRVVRRANPLAVFPTGGPLVSACAMPADLLFFDTETTGLSGGAGNTVFLLGAGYPDGSDLVLEQYFLSDFPGEKEFLSFCAPLFASHRTLVSYNGKAFDAHVLAARFSLHRLSLALPRHFDLLPPSRRLWKHAVGVCSLKNIERRVLGVERGDDIDGFEVPERYFRFLRSRDTGLLERIFYHNEIDVLSLARLLARLEKLLREGDALREVDPAALAALLFPHDRKKAEALLENGLAGGDGRAGLLLGLYYKQNREYAKAKRVWKTLFETRGSVSAGIELAKHTEHRERDYERALAVVQTILTRQPRPDRAVREALLHRKRRLEGKIGRDQRRAL